MKAIEPGRREASAENCRFESRRRNAAVSKNTDNDNARSRRRRRATIETNKLPTCALHIEALPIRAADRVTPMAHRQIEMGQTQLDMRGRMRHSRIIGR